MEQIEPEQIKKEIGWEFVAALLKNYRCSRCGERPVYAERQVYFETRLCASCVDQPEELERGQWRQAE